MQRRVFFAAAGLGTLAAAAAVCFWPPEAEAQGPVRRQTAQPGKPAVVQVAPVLSRPTAVSFTTIGTVQPARRSVVHAGEPGRVTAFLVNEGDFVTKGKELVQLRLKTLELEREAAVATLELRWQDFSELMSGYRSEEIAQARARLGQARVQEDWARAKLERLIRGGQATRPEELDDARTGVDAAGHNVTQAQANYDLAVQGPRFEQKARARALVDQAQSDLDMIDDEIWKKTLRAPFEGYVSFEHTEVGQWLAQGAPAVEIIELKELELDIKAPERFAAVLEEGQKVSVKIDALRATGLPGVIIRVVPQVDAQSRTMPVRIRLANRIGANNRPWIKAGMMAEVTWAGESLPTLLAPKDALVYAPGRDPMVYVLDKPITDGKQVQTTIRPVTVKTGTPFESYVEVQGSLEPGMQVIVRGNERVRPGQEVLATPFKE